MSDLLHHVTEAKVVHVLPGDTIFLRVEGRSLTAQTAKAIKEQAEKLWPDNEIVVGCDVDVAIVRPAETSA